MNQLDPKTKQELLMHLRELYRIAHGPSFDQEQSETLSFRINALIYKLERLQGRPKRAEPRSRRVRKA